MKARFLVVTDGLLLIAVSLALVLASVPGAEIAYVGGP